jgi:hypothetical protein
MGKHKGALDATIVLDGGCFLPLDDEARCSDIRGSTVGYYHSPPTMADIRVYVDGEQVDFDCLLKLGKQMEIRHYDSETTYKHGIKSARSLDNHLLHLDQLYCDDEDEEQRRFGLPVIDPAKFESMIHFNSGHFSESLVKDRWFRETVKGTAGKHIATGKRRKHLAVAHNLLVHFKLDEDERLEVLKDGEPFLSTLELGVTERLVIEFVAENSTGNKFYRDSFVAEPPKFWEPNCEDPPPLCPIRPCP